MSKSNIFVGCGNSIMAGNHVNPGEVYLDLVTVSLPVLAANYHNVAVPSSVINNTQGLAADAFINFNKQTNILCVMWGINNLAGGDSAATTTAALKSWCQLRKAAGWTVVVLTLLPCNSFGSANSLREATNVLIKADTSFYDALIDTGDTGTLMGNVSALTGTTYYSDGVHPTALGNTLLEPLITSGLTTLLVNSSVGWKSA